MATTRADTTRPNYRDGTAMPTLEASRALNVLIYDGHRAQSLAEENRELRVLLAAIIQRHHPNGCEVTMPALAACNGPAAASIETRYHPSRDSLIVCSTPRG